MAADFKGFAAELAKHFTVHVVARRGRGLSGPQGVHYSMAKECEDITALQRETGASFLIGHSFGGLVVLEAARNNPVFSKIAVYEPGVSIDGSISMDWVPGYEQKLAEKKYFDAFVKFSLSIGITQPCVAAGRPSRSGGKRSEERLMSIPTVYGMRSMLHWFVHASGG